MTGIVCSMVGATFGVAAVVTVIRAKKGIIAGGNAQISTAQSKFGGSSALFDAVEDYLLTTMDTGSVLQGDLTVELWARFDILPKNQTYAGGSYMMIYSCSTEPYMLVSNDASNHPQIAFGFDGKYGTATLTSTTISTNTWYHIAMVRSSGSWKAYWNGTDMGAINNDSNWTSLSTTYQPFESSVTRGKFSDGRGSWDGYMDEIRVSKTARYTTSFTPSTTPFTNDDNTLLLMHMDGTNASTFFEDDNGVRAQFNPIASGNAQIDNAQSKFGGTSALFDGTGDYLTVAASTTSPFYMMNQTFTAELWFRVSSTPTNTAVVLAIGTGDGGTNYAFGLAIRTDSKLQLAFYPRDTSNTQSIFFTGNTTFSNNTWNHIAVSGDGSTLRIFLNGVLDYSTSLTYSTAKFGQDGGVTIGANRGGGLPLNAGSTGWIDEVRISNSCRYTSAFTPPTVPFTNDSSTLLLLHMDGTDGQTVFRDDNGAVPVAITTTDAVSLDGSGDYYSATSLSSSVAADSKYALIAFNFYWNGGDNLQHPLNLRLGTGSGDYGFWIWINGGRSQLKFVTGTGSNPGSIYENTENSITANAWNQIVMWIDTTSSTTSQIWVNGNQKAYSNDGFPTGALFNWTNTATTIQIGQKNSSQTGTGADFNGRMSEVYISAASSFPGISYFWQQDKPRDLGTNGTATGLAQPLFYHYGGTSTFPTNNGTFASYTLTANGGVTTSANNSIYQTLRTQKGIQAGGNAKVSTTRSKFGGTSAYFDGVGDYLLCGDRFSFPNGSDFTIEFWVNEDVVQNTKYIGGAANDIFIGHDSSVYSNRLGVGIVNVGWYADFGVTLAADTWYHIAISRSGTTVKYFVDGDLKLTQTSGTLTTAEWKFRLQVGAELEATANTPFNGYIDELRVSNSARYTANFTPSTAPFTNDNNTVLLMHMDGTNNSTAFFDDNGIADHTA